MTSDSEESDTDEYLVDEKSTKFKATVFIRDHEKRTFKLNIGISSEDDQPGPPLIVPLQMGFKAKFTFGTPSSRYLSIFLVSPIDKIVNVNSCDVEMLDMKKSFSEEYMTPGCCRGFYKFLYLGRENRSRAGSPIKFKVEFEPREFVKAACSDSSLHSDIKDLRESGNDADVTLSIVNENDTRKFKAHKLILKSRSKYFKAMFDSSFEEASSDEIEIRDVDGNLFEKFLEFLYSGEPPKDVDQIAFDLLKIADRFELPSLVDCCAAAICCILNKDNVIDAIHLADKHDIDYLKCPAIDSFKRFLKQLSGRDDLRKTEKYEQLKSCPELLLELLSAFGDPDREGDVFF